MRRLTDEDLRSFVKERYGTLAAIALQGTAASCCAAPGNEGSCCSSRAWSDNPITGDLYSAEDAAMLPEAALLASLGCGNPTALAELHEGEVVLDLGSGGGIDVLLSAKRVGPDGFAYGLDMTDEMLALAEKNRAAAGVENVQFLKGHIEDIPLPDSTVDVIISNCVINLSADKDAVFREAFRVLKPGGRLAVSDIVWRRPVPEGIRSSAELWAGCVAGALLEEEYRKKLLVAGFANVRITPTRVYTASDLAQLAGNGPGSEAIAAEPALTDGALISAFIRARKPAS